MSKSTKKLFKLKDSTPSILKKNRSKRLKWLIWLLCLLFLIPTLYLVGREIRYSIPYLTWEHEQYLKKEQAKRDELWGHLEYTGNAAVDQLLNLPESDPLAELISESVFPSRVGKGVYMNSLGQTGVVSDNRLTIDSLNNGLDGGIDIVITVLDVEKDVVAVAEKMFEILCPTQFKELIEALNTSGFRGGEFFLDGRRVDIVYHEWGIRFLFYGLGDPNPKERS